MTRAVAERLRFWEEELAQAALDDDDARMKVCDQFIVEYISLLDLVVGSSQPNA